MRNIFAPSGELAFTGSRERLQRIISRSGGKLLPQRQFQMVLKVTLQRHIGFTFQIPGTYTPSDVGFRITYRILPTTATLLRYLLPLVLLLVFFIDSLLHASPAPQPLLALAVMALMVCGYFYNRKRCEAQFRKLFSEATFSRKVR